jgi:tetratricopeptide (TPR) repeat protein
MRYILFVIFFCISTILLSQDSRLANEYYQSGEYEKAASIYKRLYDAQPNSYFYFGRYIESLLALDQYQNAELEILRQIDKQPTHMQLYVTLGNVRERQFRPDEAEDAYRQAIANIPPDISVISNLGNAFTRLAKYDMAIEAFEKGSRLIGNEQIFAYSLADLYNRKGDTAKMIKYYIISSENSPNQLERYKTYFQRKLDSDEDLEEMRRQLFIKMQDNPDNLIYPELLEWVYIEKGDYERAFRQARSIDRKNNEGGFRVKNIGEIAYQAGDYDTAIRAFEYVAQNKSINNSLYVEAKRSLLKAKRNSITSDFNYTESELDTLQNEYESFIDEFGINTITQNLIKEYADFLALYRNDLNAASIVLNDLIKLESINVYVKANAKLALADYYLMQGDIWESTLLYSQVEKDFKEEYMGEVARFKNAQLYYYAGNFAWAQEQFDILKAATSRLIANDAIDMSVFIMDNMGLDTTDIPLKIFSEAELLTLQNKYDEAFSKLDSINTLYPEHSLADDILYQKAKLFVRLKDYDKAISLYQKVYTDYPEEIRADNAIYLLAQLYENQLQNPDEAMVLYEKLFIDFSNSSFAVEARKRYRILRGDDIQ